MGAKDQNIPKTEAFQNNFLKLGQPVERFLVLSQ